MPSTLQHGPTQENATFLFVRNLDDSEFNTGVGIDGEPSWGL
jgi:hypothetical protein